MNKILQIKNSKGVDPPIAPLRYLTDIRKDEAVHHLYVHYNTRTVLVV